MIQIISDVHGNLQALKAVLKKERLTADELWCLGDTGGYGADSRACINLLHTRSSIMLRGNHDAGLCGLEPPEHFSVHARRALETIRIPAHTREYLLSLTESHISRSITLTHASISDPRWGYILSPAAAAAELAQMKTSLGFFAHTHLPRLFLDDGGGVREIIPEENSWIDLRGMRALINPGSTGQPRDGDPRASYAMFDPENRRIQFRRCSYNIARAQKRIRRAGLPDFLARRLDEGR
ncbi:metallophosphoesterase family protein [Salinispira pacifica]|uniref:Diadenosine tetraphosphatase n=1 Tax=Salinispira pacifica TaxID=1307761 RepID=V5WFK2_9SPIO|nr:metallophosphoesterase family protein [Salinispira pacifica]AHC14420.1 Diadenosine tetraphosphatase [Salinispira pacifica]